MGIAVDRNTNSPYYGRVFVGNSSAGPGSLYGDQVGIQKLNADGSYADEGGFSNGGVDWQCRGFAPWKIRVSDDDYVYIEDWSSNGDLYRFDPTHIEQLDAARVRRRISPIAPALLLT